MSTGALLSEKVVDAKRLRIAYLEGGDPAHPTVIFVHGNVSSSVFWRTTMQVMCKRFHVLAPDLRGYGDTEALSIDATKGLRDWSGDLHSFVAALHLNDPVHFVGWSMGGGIVMQYAIDYAPTVASLTLINPLSPFGFGGTKDVAGTPTFDDYAGAGGGTVNADFVERIRAGDTSGDNPSSPRNVMNQFYFKPPFRADEGDELVYVASMLSTKTGPGFYPGGLTVSENWPGVAPGNDGVANAMAPKFVNLWSLVDIEQKPPILWIRGEQDQIVSDSSLFDLGTLGKLGLVPGWPGEDVFPPQPMVAQTRYVFDEYQKRGGLYEEFVVADSGHSPHIEQPKSTTDKMVQFLTVNTASRA